MKLVNGLRLAVVLGVLLLAAGSALWAQTPVQIKIYATDGFGSDSVTIGVHPLATGQIDSITLGEMELPPPPPSFDFRSVSMTGYDTLAGGVALNLHKLVFDTQLDMYRLQFQSDASGGDVVFSWQAGLASVGAGFWHLHATDPNTATIYDIDMTQQTSFTMAGSMSVLPQTIVIVKGDGKAFRTATYADLASASDSKAKQGKAEKAKPYASYACFTFNNTDTAAHTVATITFSQNITSITPSATTGTKVITLNTLNVPIGGSFQVCAYGDKGKALVVSKWWWGTTKPKVLPALPTLGFNQLLLKMPNYNNVGTELYAQGAFPGSDPVKAKPAGLFLGKMAQVGVDAKLKPIYRYVYHAKWGDLVKTMNNNGKSLYHTGTGGCLYQVNASKDVKKPLSNATADKYNNGLIGELAALKFNIAMNQIKVPGGGGFGSMQYRAQLGDPASFDGMTVQAIADQADSALSCFFDSLAHTPYNFPGLVGVIHNINGAFSAPFDTVSFGAKTQMTPVKALAEQSVLYRLSLTGNFASTPDNFVRGPELPDLYKLEQNYPNPFNPTTTIQFSLAEDAMVTLKVYNVLGQEVATLADHEQYNSGINEVTFDASRMASGVYYYRLLVNDGAKFQQVKKMMLIK